MACATVVCPVVPVSEVLEVDHHGDHSIIVYRPAVHVHLLVGPVAVLVGKIEYG